MVTAYNQKEEMGIFLGVLLREHPPHVYFIQPFIYAVILQYASLVMHIVPVCLYFVSPSSCTVLLLCCLILANSLTTVGYLLEVFIRLWIPSMVRIFTSAWS